MGDEQRMNRNELERDFFDEMRGRMVFFMSGNAITKGRITGMDSHQIFVGSTYGIQKAKEFFFSEDELVISLKSNAEEI
jgi:hypothetical protein